MSPVHAHLLLNHIPVIGLLFVIALLAAAFWRRSSELGKAALSGLVVIGLVTGLVFLTGEPAEEAVEDLAGVSEALIHSHEEVAEAALIATGVAGFFALLALWRYRRRELPRPLLATCLAMVLGLSGIMSVAANLGGQIRHTEIRAMANAPEQELEQER